MINHPDPAFRKDDTPVRSAFQLSYKTDLAYFGADGWLAKYPDEAAGFALGLVRVTPLEI
jgi:hypothetical protein